jgi:hypothetical protein
LGVSYFVSAHNFPAPIKNFSYLSLIFCSPAHLLAVMLTCLPACLPAHLLTCLLTCLPACGYLLTCLPLGKKITPNPLGLGAIFSG